MLVFVSHANFPVNTPRSHLMFPMSSDDFRVLTAYNFINSHVFDLSNEATVDEQTENPVQACEMLVENYTGVDPDSLDDSICIPKHFVCPISMEVMRDPVVASDGHTYERTFIMKWLSKSTKSPATNAELTCKTVVPNFNLRIAISEWFVSVKRHPCKD